MPDSKKSSINIQDTSLHFNIDGYKKIPCWASSKKASHYTAWKTVLKFLKEDGWDIYVAEEYKNGGEYSILRGHRRRGMKGFSYCTLEFSTEIYPRGFKFKFYQNHNFKNRHGGRFDFDKYKKMPYLLKKAFELTSRKICSILLRFFPNTSVDIETKDQTSSEKILSHFQSRSFTRKHITSLDQIESLMGEYDFKHNSTDRDGKRIQCGEVKYSYGYKGFLQRGTVYHNINNMWWFIWNDSYYSNLASSALFDLNPEDLNIRRLKRHTPPKEYIERKAHLGRASIKELENEIKRRLKSD